MTRYRFVAKSGIAISAAASIILLAGVATAAVDWVGVPTDPSVPLAFEDPENWETGEPFDPEPSVGQETAPPGEDSIWFAENVEVTIELNDERTGENGTQRMGTFAFGGDPSSDDNVNQTLILNNSVTLTAWERDGDTGEVRDDGNFFRALRLGRENSNPPAPLSGATTDDFPWGILLHRAGTLQYDPNVPEGNAHLDFSRDKPQSGGALYEISGDAVLNLAGAARFGDRDNGGERTTPGAIFRVRDSSPTVNVGDFINESRLGLWDHDNDHPSGATRMNLGKFVTEFVLDADGVAPIVVADELRIGRTEDIGGSIEVGYGFLRIKLSEPTTAGSGAVGSGDELVLFQADRIASLVDLGDPESEIAMGRFFDPDREGLNSGGDQMLPHAGLWEGTRTVIADYAGAQYTWQINYFDSDDDEIVIDAVVLSELEIDGTPGDLNGDTLLDEADRTALMEAIADPSTIRIGDPQHLFDLNADDAVNDLDLALFDSVFLAPGGVPGDYNGDGLVDAADYTVWRDSLGSTTLDNRDPGLNGPVGEDDYNFWKSNFGSGASGNGTVAAAVPEPRAAGLALAAAVGLLALRRGTDNLIRPM